MQPITSVFMILMLLASVIGPSNVSPETLSNFRKTNNLETVQQIIPTPSTEWGYPAPGSTPEPTIDPGTTPTPTPEPQSSPTFVPTATEIPAVTATPSTPDTETGEVIQTKRILKDGGEIIGQVGKYKVKVKFPKDALPNSADVTIRNPSGKKKAKRLPDNEPFELVAKDAETGNSIHQFSTDVEIEITINPAITEEDISALVIQYFDEQTLDWTDLPTTKDRNNNIISAKTNHFSLFDVTSETLSQVSIPSLDAAQVADFTGSASYEIPIEVPAGPGGLQPSISLSYNSQASEGATLETQASWVGMGWSLSSGGAIMRHEGRRKDWEGDDTFSLVLGNRSYTLIPVEKTSFIQRNETRSDGSYHINNYIDYKTSDESFLKIRRYRWFRDNVTGDYVRDMDLWVVWDKTGNVFTFNHLAWYLEKYRDDENQVFATMRPWAAYLSSLKNAAGQSLTFSYAHETSVRCALGDCGYSAWMDTAVYPTEIAYPDGHTKVVFDRDGGRTDFQLAWDNPTSWFRFERSRLTGIRVMIDTQVIREYRLVYEPNVSTTVSVFPSAKWTYNNVTGAGRTLVLKQVTEYGLGGSNGSAAYPPIDFTYNGLFLSEVNNNQGGKVAFTYETTPWHAVDGPPNSAIPESQVDDHVNQLGDPWRDLVTINTNIRPGTTYRLHCALKTANPAYSGQTGSVVYYLYDGLNYYNSDVITLNSTQFTDHDWYIPFSKDAKSGRFGIQWVGGLGVYFDNCYVQQVVTHFRVTAKTLTSLPDNTSYTFQYSYLLNNVDSGSVNDPAHSVFASLASDLRSPANAPNTQFRGNGFVEITSPDGRRVQRTYGQSDTLQGKLLKEVRLNNNRSKFLAQQTFTYGEQVNYVVPTGTPPATTPCPKYSPSDYATRPCLQDQKVTWVYLKEQETRDYSSAASSTDENSPFIGVKSYFGYDSWGNLTDQIEHLRNGAAWVPYRASHQTFPANISSAATELSTFLSSGNTSIDQIRYLTALPGTNTLYTCLSNDADGSCSGFNLLTQPTGQGSYLNTSIEAASCNLYEDPINGGTGICSVNQNSAAVPVSGILTGTRTLLHFGDGTDPDYANPHFSDTFFYYDAWGNQVKTVTFPAEGTATARAAAETPSTTRETSLTYDTYFHARVISQTQALTSVSTITSSYGESLNPKPNGYWYGLPYSETDPNGAVAYAFYDLYGRMVSLVLPGDNSYQPTLQASYYFGSTDAPAWLEVARVTPYGSAQGTRKFFDGLGRLIQAQSFGVEVEGTNAYQDLVTQYENNANGQVTRQTVPTSRDAWHAGGETPAPAYQAVAFLETSGTTQRNYIRTEHDLNGRVVKISQPDGSDTNYQYEIYNSKLKTTSTRLNNQTNIISETYQDAFGRTVQVVPPDGPGTFYSYSIGGMLTTTTYGNAITTITYDNAGRKVALKDPDTGVIREIDPLYWHYAYDALGNIIRQEDAKGQVTCLFYDRLNRVKGKMLFATPQSCADPGSGYDVAFTYDQYTPGNNGNNGKGRRTGMSDASGDAAWEYDLRGRVFHASKHIVDKDGGDVDLGTYHTYWSYNSDNSIRQMVYPNGETVNFAYNNQGSLDQMHALRDAGTSDVTDFYVQHAAYDAAGRMTRQTIGNGYLETSYSYFDWATVNGLGRLKEIKTVMLSDASVLQDLQYVDAQSGPDVPGYDSLGIIRYIEDLAAQQQHSYGYDNLSRLTSAAVSGVGPGLYSETYTYNASTGNLATKIDGTGTHAYAYDPVHPHAVLSLSDVGTYSYDYNGNMTGRTVDQSYTLAYNIANQLTSISGGTSVRYLYDGDGKRVLVVNGSARTIYVGDYFEAEFTSGTAFPAQAPALTNDAMCHDNRCFRVFLPAVMQDDPETPPIGMAQGNFGATFYHTHAATPPAGTTWKMYYGKVAVRAQSAAADDLYFLLRDHLGSVVKSVNAANGNETSLLYTAWGETRDSSGAMPTARQFTGQLQADAGLYFYQARFYDPYLNRFLSPDDIVPDPYNPIDWDRYSYCRNNPINNIDPSGHITKAIFAGDGDVWSPPISSYGVTVSDGWTLEDKVQIASELQIMSNMLTSMCPDGNCFGMAPHEVFHKVFGDTTISRVYDGEGIGCVAGNPVECSEGTGGQLILNSQNGLIIHEFGHNFDHKINGWGYARNTLANSTISVNGDHVSGFNPVTGTYERTTRGYRSDNYPDVQHPLRKDGNSSGEDFADMFLNYSRGTFATDIYGQARYLWMVGNMASWMGTISSRWQK